MIQKPNNDYLKTIECKLVYYFLNRFHLQALQLLMVMSLLLDSVGYVIPVGHVSIVNLIPLLVYSRRLVQFTLIFYLFI